MSKSKRERLRALRAAHQKDVGRRDMVLSTIHMEEERAAKFEAGSLVDDDALEILQAAIEARRQELKDRVESLVTKGLRAVFAREDYEFEFDMKLKGDIVHFVPVLRCDFDGQVLETEIADAHGGGVADVVSFLLRVIVLSLARPRPAPVLVLDEPFRHVSPEYLGGVAGLLVELNQSAGIQFLLVTHKAELLDAADVVYRATMGQKGTEFTLEHATRDRSYHARPKKGQEPVALQTPFAHEDMTRPIGFDDAEPRLSDTVDKWAIRHRYPHPPWPGSRQERWEEMRRLNKRRKRVREEKRIWRKRRRERDPDWREGKG